MSYSEQVHIQVLKHVLQILKNSPASVYKRSRFLERFSLSEDKVIDGTILITETGNYNIDNAFDDIKTRYLDVIKGVIDE